MKKSCKLLMLVALLGVSGLTGCEPKDDTPVVEPITKKIFEVSKEPKDKTFIQGDLFSLEGFTFVKYTETDGKKSSPIEVSSSEYTSSIAVGDPLNVVTDDLKVTLTMVEEGYNSLTLDFVVKAPTTYAVTFKNEDGTVYETTSFKENEQLVYEGETPSKAPSDNGEYYTFDYWYVEGDEAKRPVDLSTYKLKADTTFVAHFSVSTSVFSENGLKYMINNGGKSLTVIGLADKNYDTEIIIPDIASDNLPVTAIGREAFFYNTNITTVTIGSNVVEIAVSAFEETSYLSTIKFSENSKIERISDYAFKDSGLNEFSAPKSLKYIGKDVFTSNYSLTTLTLNEGLLSIGDEAFYGTAITSFKLPTSVVNLGTGILVGTDSLASLDLGLSNLDFNYVSLFGTDEAQALTTYIVSSDNTKYTVENGVLYSKDKKILYSVPSKAYLDNNEEEKLKEFVISDSVETLADYAFFYDQGYSKVTFGANLKKVGKYVFSNAVKIQSFVFNDKLEVIDDYGFSGLRYGLSEQKEIVLPDSVKSVGDYAFQNAKNLTSFTFGAGIEKIGQNVFDGCSNLNDNIHFSENGNIKKDSDGAVYNKDKTEVFFYFRDDSLTSYVLPSTVTTVNASVFSNASNLTEFTVPENSALKTIGNSAFSGISNVSSSIKLPETLTYIGDEAFYGAYSLLGINVPSKLEYLGNDAFNGLTSANFGEEVVLPETLKYVGSNAFAGDELISKVTINNDSVSEGEFSDATGLTSVTLNSKITSIANDAFTGASSLSTLNLNGASITSVGESAFEDAPLTSFDFTKLTSIGDDAFNGNHFSEVVLPETLVSLGSGALSNSSTLSKVTINASLTFIPDSLFEDDEALSEVNIPTTVTEIGESSFTGTKLTSVTLPEGLTKIGRNAFKNCSSLTSINIPSSLNNVGSDAFSGTALTGTLVLSETLTTMNGAWFKGTGYTSLVVNGKFDVSRSPFRQMEELQTIEFKNGIMANENDSTTFETRSFEGDKALTSINWGGTVINSISQSAFKNCESITYEGLGFDTSKVTSIDYYAFQNAKKLTQFTFSTDASFTEIYDNAFDGSGLTSVYLPENIATVGGDAFSNCENLTSLTIMNPEIDLYTYDEDWCYTFENCNNLKSVTFNGTIEQAKKALTGSGLVNGCVVTCTDGSYTVEEIA